MVAEMNILQRFLRNRRYRKLSATLAKADAYAKIRLLAEYHLIQERVCLDYRARIAHKINLVTVNVDAITETAKEVRRHLLVKSAHCHRIVNVDKPRLETDLNAWTTNTKGYGVSTLAVGDMLCKEALWLSAAMISLEEEDVVLHDHVYRSLLPYVNDLIYVLNALVYANNEVLMRWQRR